MYSYDDSRRGGTAPTSNAQGLGLTTLVRRSHDGNPSFNIGIASPETELEDRISRLSIGSGGEQRLVTAPNLSKKTAGIPRNFAVPTPRRPATRQIGTNNCADAVDDLNRALKHDRFCAAAATYSDDLNDEDTKEYQRAVKKSGWVIKEPGSPGLQRCQKANGSNPENEVSY